MATQPIMMILTSNEDLIRQFCSNKTKDTHILNLDCLADLSEFNSKNAKQVFDSSQLRLVKIPKKSSNQTCSICSNHAVGFNYNVLSCAPCKIFFRRNANQKEKLRCLSGEGQCSVVYGTRRRCPRCRLDRCFAMGMRKDFILSEERKQQRRKHAKQPLSESTDKIDHLLMNMDEDDDIIVIDDSYTNPNQIKDISLEKLSVEDLITIENLRSSFLSIFVDHNIQCSCVDESDRISALISWSQFFSRNALHFISFFRKIDQFENLDVDDRFILIKYNVFSLFLLSRCFYYKSVHDCCSYDDNEFTKKHRRFFMLCGDSYGIRDTFVNTILSLVHITEQDPILLSLLVTILIFTHGLSMNEDEPILKDSLAVNRAQCYYTTLLWNYLVNKRGEIETCRHFTHLFTVIIRIQSVGKTMREFFRVQSMTSDIMDRIAPLMQTLLLIP